MLGTRGGVGCTTLAVNLAATLASRPENTVALVDLDLALGDCDVALDMIADHTIVDLVLNIDKLDLNFIRRSILHHKRTNLHLLAHPLQITDIGMVQPPHLERILNLLKFNFSHLVLDSPIAIFLARFSKLAYCSIGERAPVEEFGLFVAALVAIEEGQVVEARGSGGVVRPMRFLPDGECTLVKRQGRFVAALVPIEQRQIVEAGGGVRDLWPLRFLGDGGALVERLGLDIFCTLP